MTRRLSFFVFFCIMLMVGCSSLSDMQTDTSESVIDPVWENANIYFLMTDRFRNGDPSNDASYGRRPDGDMLRSFEGGDIPGIIDALEEGYFKNLGVTAIWTTPVIEQIRQPFEEYGRSYPFHGYWPRDWTRVDKAFGTEADFERMIELAHSQGIRIIVDVIVNHAGPPINEIDPAWPSDWVDTGPRCDYKSFAGTADCLIVPALQEMRTESTQEVDIPDHLAKKWKEEGRYESEMAELDAFFDRTGLTRTPRHYLIKWNTDWVRDYGVDGFRIDTAKHVEPEVWDILKREAELALTEWRKNNPDKSQWNTDFYMVGEVFNFGALGFQNTPKGTRLYDYGDLKVDFFDYGFDALINMGFATHAEKTPDDLFKTYAEEMDTTFEGVGLVNYLSSHDDGNPRDPERQDSWMNAAKLVLAPGAVQIYYGDETDRRLVVEGTTGDAKLRSPMNWADLQSGQATEIHAHWTKLLNFRRRHVAVGAGVHREISKSPYSFSRSHDEQKDQIIIGLDRNEFSALPVGSVFANGTKLRESYSGETVTVMDGRVSFSTPRKIALLELSND